MLAFVVIAVFGVIVCVTGPAFDDHWERRRKRLDFPKVKLLTSGPCTVCGRTRCPFNRPSDCHYDLYG